MLSEFILNFKSCLLSTLTKENLPFSSYAPFICYNHCYYIFISDIAKHSKNLKNNPHLSLFFIEDESMCENIFARKRVQLDAKAQLINKESETFSTVIKLFEEQHGATVNILKKMSDFKLFEITPSSGEAVFGFGKAYNVGGKHCNELLQREGVKGHQSK
ncbi:HugZ family protein [Candidatus Marinarcus aquaticus]|uniref:Heme iron utilization protein n=1 Tax=Candidatus Marinarcus aquaticus TaxID=2044504 RepID=A0A4Q0XSQ7_9BACT|nr:pyridoxamine 5'-phosphate oxidase family protein [Candidatus Marinarcus aquaticus]RXJ60053.1 heme iron utilization protein [Candidatus Marinarcus aquaticus]